MKLHRNARTTPFTRKFLVERIESGESVRAAAEAVGVSRSTAYKWLRRWQEQGLGGLEDRSSAPQHIPHKTPAGLVRRIEALRRKRWTGRAIAARLQMARSTVSVWLRRLGLGLLRALTPPRIVRRYEKQRPGELLHLDVKKLGRFRRPGHRVIERGPGSHSGGGMGWDFVHVCIDDHSRLAYVEVLDDEKGPTAAGFVRRAISWLARRKVSVERVMTDNGACYRSHFFGDELRRAQARHIRTRPYRPETNGKAERFIQTLMREWAYAKCYRSSKQRDKALAPWLNYYNRERPHGSLGFEPPVARLRARVSTT
ncbi:MAG: IS481 family transposase [Planctomycetota bacterium]